MMPCSDTVKHTYMYMYYIRPILEWTTSLDSSSGSLICDSLCPRHVGRNYEPLFGVDTDLRYYVIRDVIVI